MPKSEIHPVYPPARIHCACGNQIETRSTRGSFNVEICSNCHPYYTGKYKLIDTAGRVDRFRKKYQGNTGGADKTAAAAAAAGAASADAASAGKAASAASAGGEKPAGEKAPKAKA